MTFNSLQYAAFLPIVLLLYWQLTRRAQNLLLLVASYVFYAAFDWRFTGLLALSTVLDFEFGRRLARTPTEGHRKRWLVASLVVNLGILGAFKYFTFFSDSFAQLLDHVGIDATGPAWKVLLPVGISFYTFHGISYVFDVYRGDVRAADDLVDYAVFVAFFPQLVAGPIGRAHLQLPQFERERTLPGRSEAGRAVLQILYGLFKKVVIADGMAPIANAAFRNAEVASSISLLLGAYAFALQIYGDFSGYSDIARGSARLLGIELPHNFHEPYLARNITDFWRRWHISLSRWLRDYLYVPLGGNRGTAFGTYRNLILVMLIGGLWHGAAWTFVVWGGLHGVLLALHRWWATSRGHERVPTTSGALVSRLLTFHAVVALWVVFRAPDFSSAGTYFRRLLGFHGGAVNLDDVLLVLGFLALVVALDVIHQRVREGRARSWLERAPVARDLAVAAAVTGVVLFSGGTPTPFIYFRF